VEKEQIPLNSKDWIGWIVRVKTYAHTSDVGEDNKDGNVVIVKAPDKETAVIEATRAGYIATGVVVNPRQHEQPR